MDPFRMTIILLIITCMLSSLDALGFQQKKQEATFQSSSSSGTFGRKTTGSSSSGTFTNILKPSETPELKRNPISGSSQSVSEEGFNSNRKNNFGSIAQNTEQDDTVYGLLPAEDIPQTPASFGTRIQSTNNQPDCDSNGVCQSALQSSVGQFGGSSSENQQTQPGHFSQEDINENDDQSVHSFVERRENVDNIEQEDQFSDDGNQNQLGVTQTDLTDNGQVEAEFRNSESGEANNNNQEPVIDADYSEQGDGKGENPEENFSSFQDNQGTVDTSQVSRDDSEARQNPSNFDYVDQQSYLDAPAEQVSDSFEPASVEPENVPFQQDKRIEDRNNQFDQGSFQQPSIVPQSVAKNEFSNDFNNEARNDYFEEDPIQALRYNVPGSPGEDYPIFYKVPETSFDCNQQQFAAGIFGDVDAQCQVFHFCKENGGQDSFLCPNGTVFNQQYFVCDWWYNYNCADTPGFYNLNAQLYWDFDTISPTQILTGSGIGSQEDEEFDQEINLGGVAMQTPSAFNSGSQSQVPFFNTQTTPNVQESFNTRTSFQKDNIRTSSGFSEQRSDTSFQQDRSRSTSSIQNNFAQSTGFSVQGSNVAGGDLRNNPATQEAIDFPNNPSEIEDISNVDDSGQAKIDFDEEFRQIVDERAPVTTNFEQKKVLDSQDSGNKGSNVDQDSFTNEQFESSISSDPNRNSQPEADVGTKFPDQNGFEQQKEQDDQEPQPNVETFIDETSEDNLNQDKFDDISTGFIDGGDQNVPQEEIFQQAVEIPLEETNARSDEGIDSVQGPKESFSNEAFEDQNKEDLEQQNIDPVSINNEEGTVEEINDDVFDQDTESNGNVDDSGSSVAGEKQTQVNDNFDQRDQIDVTSINQEAINIDEILDGFEDRDNAFKDSNLGSQINSNGQTINGNRSPFVPESVSQSANQNNINLSQKPVTDIPFTQNNIAIGSNLGQNSGENIQQQKLQENNIYNMMRGYPNNGRIEQNRNRPTPNQQRLNFRPYGQNASPTINSNFEESNQNSGGVNSPQNVEISQQKNQEEVIFPNEQGQRNGETQWWQNSQQGTNFNSGSLPNQRSKNLNAQPREQANNNFNRPSNRNWNVPTNGHQMKTTQAVQGVQNNQNRNRNIIPNPQQPIEQNSNNRNPSSGENTQKNTLSGTQSNFRSLSNGGSSRFQGVKGVISPIQAQFNRAQFSNRDLPNKNTQAIARQNQNQQPQSNSNAGQQVQSIIQNRNQKPQSISNSGQQAQSITQNRNQQPQSISNSGQQAQRTPQNLNVLQLRPVVRSKDNSRVKGQFSRDQSQFRSIPLISANIPNQRNSQTVPANNPEQFSQGKIQNTIQSNSGNIPNNNQQHSEEQFNQIQFQNNIQFNSRNIPTGNNQQGAQQNRQGQPIQNQFQGPILFNSENIANDNQKEIVHQQSQEQREPNQFQNNIPFDSRNIPNGNNQQFVQQSVSDHNQGQFHNIQFNSENVPNGNNQVFGQQNIPQQQQNQFRNNIQFSSGTVQNGNNQVFSQQNIPEQEQGQFHGNNQFTSRNIPTGNNQVFVQQNVPTQEQGQFQDDTQFNSRNIPNGNNQVFVQQNVPEQEQGQFQGNINSGNGPNGNNRQFVQQRNRQEQFRQEQQHFQFEQQARNDHSFTHNVQQGNPEDVGGILRDAGASGEFVQEQLQLNSEPVNQVTDNNQFFEPENVRGARSGFNNPNPLGQIQPQKINANDAIVYSQNDPPVAESSINYNGWRPILRN